MKYNTLKNTTIGSSFEVYCSGEKRCYACEKQKPLIVYLCSLFDRQMGENSYIVVRCFECANKELLPYYNISELSIKEIFTIRTIHGV